MAFETVPVTMLELDLDICNNVYGVAPCTAGTDITTGTSQTGSTATTIKLAAGASGTDDFYNDDAITVVNGRAIITDYDGTTKIATVDRNWPINILTYSEQFDNAAWLDPLTQWTVVANGETAPNGTATADVITVTGTTALIRHNVSPDPNTPISFSVWAKVISGTITGFGCDFGDSASQALLSQLQTGEWVRCQAPNLANTTANNFMDMVPTFSAAGGEIALWGAQLEKYSTVGEYVVTTSAVIDLPDSVAYRVITVGPECYNTFQTCQDKPNYVKATHTHKFVTKGAPVPVTDNFVRPYIDSISFAPTVIDLEKGLAARASVTVTLSDEPDSDTEDDPYHDTRATPPQGTFWRRLLARNQNYAGRFARIKRGYFTAGWDAGAFVTELYIIDKITGPNSSGQVKVTLKDPVKLADRRKYPEPTAGKVLADITSTALSVTLNTGDGALYTSTGYVRIGKEVIQYTGNTSDVLSWPDVSYRAQFGTTAKEAKAKAAVQQCAVWDTAKVSTVLNDLLLAAGIPSGNIDTAGMLLEDDTWLGVTSRITVCLPDPEDISKLLKELCIETNGYMWFDPVAQKVKYQVLAPLAPAETVAATFTDEGSVIEGTTEINIRDDLRITVSGMLGELESATADRGEAVNYLIGELFIDADAESANEYNDRRIDIKHSRWFGEPNAGTMLATVTRRVAALRDPPKEPAFKVDAKDAAVREGELVDVLIGEITDTTGAPLTVRCLVLKRRDEDGQISLVMRTTPFTQRYGFIGANSLPDYGSATDDDKKYAYIAPDAGFSDGSDSYLIF
jgi:hypothetical protein